MTTTVETNIDLPTLNLTKEEVKQDLRKGIVQIAYVKLDGTLNNRRATLNFSLIPAKDHPKGDEEVIPSAKNEGYVNYYDLEKGEWRKFHMHRLKEIHILFELNPVSEVYEYHTLRFKKLTYEAVKQKAAEYFEQHKILTTLHLKKALREAGYWAVQARVSELMQELATCEADWKFSEQEGEAFRLYYQEVEF
jgi:hypothetical protein